MKGEKWYILLAFSVLVFSQCMTWITYGTVPTTTRQYYGISVHQLDLLINWGSILYVVMAIPMMVVISSPRGLAYSVRLSAILVLLSNVLRCLPSLFFPPKQLDPQSLSSSSATTTADAGTVASTSSPGTLAILHISQILNACAGPISMTPCALLSHIWFEPRLRTTVTTIAWISSGLGITFSYLACPYIVGDSNIPVLLYSELAVSLLAFVLIFAHFPQEPTKDSSIHKDNPLPDELKESDNNNNNIDHENNESKPILIKKENDNDNIDNDNDDVVDVVVDERGVKRTSAWTILLDCINGIKVSFSSVDSSLAVIAGGIQLGIGSGWGSCLPQVLAGLDFSERVSGVLSFVCSILGSASSLAIGQVNDIRRMRRRHKALALGSFAVSLVFLGAFLLYVRLPGAPRALLEPSHAEALVILCGISVSTSCITPLFYEMLAEITYPVNQAISSGLVALLGNTFAVAYLVAAPYMNPGIYVLVFVASSLSCLVLTSFVHVSYRRQDSMEKE